MPDRRAGDDWQPGERDVMQRGAQDARERFGTMDALIGEHSKHLATINGSMGTLAAEMARQATATAVLATTMKSIEADIDLERQERSAGRGLATQWWIAILAAVMAMVGLFVTVVLTFVVLFANGAL